MSSQKRSFTASSKVWFGYIWLNISKFQLFSSKKRKKRKSTGKIWEATVLFQQLWNTQYSIEFSIGVYLFLHRLIFICLVIGFQYCWIRKSFRDYDAISKRFQYLKIQPRSTPLTLMVTQVLYWRINCTLEPISYSSWSRYGRKYCFVTSLSCNLNSNIKVATNEQFLSCVSSWLQSLDGDNYVKRTGRSDLPV